MMMCVKLRVSFICLHKVLEMCVALLKPIFSIMLEYILCCISTFVPALYCILTFLSNTPYLKYYLLHINEQD